MKILVLSDSHGNVENMKSAVEQEKPDMIIHLGDCQSDALQLKALYPDIPLEGVPGNCDSSMDPAERVLMIEGKRVFILHGHTRGVKMMLFRLQMAAKEKEADLALFGHTHMVHYDYHNGVQYMNPGSIGAPGHGNPPSYGVLYIEEGRVEIKQEIKYIDRK